MGYDEGMRIKTFIQKLLIATLLIGTGSGIVVALINRWLPKHSIDVALPIAGAFVFMGIMSFFAKTRLEYLVGAIVGVLLGAGMIPAT